MKIRARAVKRACRHEVKSSGKDDGSEAGQNENGDEVAHWWFFHAEDTSDFDALAARVEKAVQDAQKRERELWADLGRVPPRLTSP